MLQERHLALQASRTDVSLLFQSEILLVLLPVSSLMVLTAVPPPQEYMCTDH